MSCWEDTALDVVRAARLYVTCVRGGHSMTIAKVFQTLGSFHAMSQREVTGNQ